MKNRIENILTKVVSLVNKINNTEKKYVKSDFLSNRNDFCTEQYEFNVALDTPLDDYSVYGEYIQAFVYRDLDLKKRELFSYMNNLPQPLSEEAKEKIRLNKIELSRSLDKLIRQQTTIDEVLRAKMSNSPIPRHPSTPKDQ